MARMVRGGNTISNPATAAFAFAVLAVSVAAPCPARLIDDFSVDQTGISTDQFAAYDQIVSSELLGGDRWIWGGGASIPGACTNCEISGTVSDGRFVIVPGADCPGAIAVQWGRFHSLGLNIAGDTGIQLDIAEITGVGWTRVSIYSGDNPDSAARLDVFPNSTGLFTIPFSSFGRSIDLRNIHTIVVATYLDLGEFIAIDAVRTIPEPSTISLLFFAIGCTMFKNSRGRHPSRTQRTV